MEASQEGMVADEESVESSMWNEENALRWNDIGLLSSGGCWRIVG